MASRPHATSEEQIAELGKIRRIPRDVDMFTGEVVTKPPKRGNGRHIVLKPTGIEKPVVPGMASYAGEGPHGKYCRDCDSFGEVAVVRPDGAETIEMNRRGCVKWASRMGHAQPMGARSIDACAACKHFTEAVKPVRRFVIDQAGKIIPLDNFPTGNLRVWLRKNGASA